MRKTIVAFAILLSACVSVAPRVAVTGVSDRLYCGRDIPDGGGEVSDAQVEAFLDEVVEPRFPEGYTVWTAMGMWKGGEEKTLVIELVHPYGLDFDRKIREIADEYRRRFRQNAVMRVTNPAVMEFIDE
jgi:hypothetical protein